jgi:hypothetical protein
MSLHQDFIKMYYMLTEIVWQKGQKDSNLQEAK